jgi:hypothetical protein
MTPVLSPNTQVILLLTAPLIAGRGPVSSDLLSPSEYKRLASHLREIQRQPVAVFHPQSARTSILRGRASARLGMRTRSTPSLRVASISPVSSSPLRPKLRR